MVLYLYSHRYCYFSYYSISNFISFAVYILMFFLINALRVDRNLRKYGVPGGIRGLYKSLSSTVHDGNSSSGPEEYGYSPLKFIV
jgi:hypothetical protein